MFSFSIYILTSVLVQKTHWDLVGLAIFANHTALEKPLMLLPWGSHGSLSLWRQVSSFHLATWSFNK